MHPAIIGAAPIDEDISPKSFNSKMKAPKIAGMETINENSPARERFTPPKRAPAIVEPLREMPGKVPNPCIIPIIIDCLIEMPVNSLGPFADCLFSIMEEKINNADVTKNPPQTNFTPKSGINLLVKIPNVPVIAVVKMIAIIVF